MSAAELHDAQQEARRLWHGRRRHLRPGEVVRVSPGPGRRRLPGIIKTVHPDGLVTVAVLRFLSDVTVPAATVTRVRRPDEAARIRLQVEGVRAAARSLANALPRSHR